MTDKVRILIGMGTCGLAAGAQAVYDAVVENLKSLNIEADIISTGCVGYCQKEVIVDIQKPGFPKLSYGDVTADNAVDLLKSVLVDGRNNSHLIIGKYRTEKE